MNNPPQGAMANPQNDSIELRDYIAILKARKWSVILVTLLILGSALAFSFAQTPLYGATTRLLIVPPGTLGPVNPVTYIVTEAQLLSSEPVAALVKEDLGLSTSTSALLSRLTVSDVPDASVLNIIFVSPDAELARDVPNSFARNYLSYKRQRATEETERARQSVQAEIDEVTTELARISDRLSDAGRGGDAALRSSLENQRTVLLARLGVLQQQLNSVAPDQGAPHSGEIIQAAQLPGAPFAPSHVKNGLLAAFLGLALGVAVAFIRERLDDRFKSRSDIERAVGVPVLATIPWSGGRRSKRRKATAEEGLVIRNRPKGVASEAYRGLRANLQFIMTQRELKSVLLTSAASAEGKTVTSSNLAVAMAQAGKRVILVSGDMRRPTLEQLFGLERNRGLSNWLMGEEIELNHLIVDPGIPNLRILPSGVIPANSAELLTTINVTRLIGILEANADLVIIDSPPALAVADANVISSVVGGVLLVLHGSASHRSGVLRAREEIARAGGQTLGIVLNAWEEAAGTYYHYDAAYQDSSPQTLESAKPHPPEAPAGKKSRRRLRIGPKS